MSLIDWNNHLTVNADIDVNIVIWTVYKENFPLTKQKLYSYPWITTKIKWLAHQKKHYPQEIYENKESKSFLSITNEI